MKNALRVVLVLCAATSMSACKTIDQRYYYRQAITQFDKHLPPAGKSCWLTPDLVGPGAGSNAIAEEEFTKYLIERGLCRVVEKHGDDVAGYTWPKDEVCPCGANVQVCSAQCEGKAPGAAPVSSGFGLPSLGGGAVAADDNNRSTDKLLERYKKSQLVDKLIVYRIDEMNDKKCIVHFRVSDAKANSGAIEASQTYTVFPKVEESTSSQ